jgi:glycosyltransferase involved in cell wall biosynthesis
VFKLTIAICTYNRHEFLNECLSRLLPQIERGRSIRVLVIDNNSSDETKQTVSIKQEKYHFLDYAFCKEQGLSHARNYALKEADSIWLSFLDDDGYPDDDWLKQNLRIIDSRNFDAWGGVYLSWFRDGKKVWFKDEYETNGTWMPKSERRLLPSDPYFSGGNCTFHRQKLLNAGVFPVELGMNGNKAAYGEEVLAQRNLATKGGILGFSPDLIIHHYTPIKKQSVFWVWRRNFIIGRDFWDIYGKDVSQKNIKFYLMFSFKKAVDETKRSIKNFISTEEPHNLSNVLYELNTWVYLVGILFGALKKFKF